MLPGCATVVLETVSHLQNYAVTKVSVVASRNNLICPPELSTVKLKNLSIWLEGEKSKISAAMDAMYATVAHLTLWADRLIVEGKVDPSEDYRNTVIDPVRESVTLLATLVTELECGASLRLQTSFRTSLPDVTVDELPPERDCAPPLPPKALQSNPDWFQNPLFRAELPGFLPSAAELGL